jgi:response regulator RpfG family c-di-GMP phosphodiesterase
MTAVSATATADAGRASTVLLVDDEPNILRALRRVLRGTGWAILDAPDGPAALALLDAHPVDLVLSDMRMPGMDGAALLHEVHRRRPEAVRMLLTGYADVRATIDAVNRGRIARYIAKPWNDDELVGALRDGLRIKHLEDEARRLHALTVEQNASLQTLNRTLEDRVRARTAELEQAMGMLEAAHGELKRNFHESVRVFTGLLELRAPLLAGHARRVAELARAIAARLDVQGTDAQDIVLAALLHDVGCIGLPDDVIALPPGAMTGGQVSAWQRHPVRGEAALMGLGALQRAARLVRHHHERHDGDGFPDALAAAAIPLGARILAVAEDYDELQLGLAVRRRMDADEAARYIEAGRGSRYDPEVVTAFVAVVQGMRASRDATREVTTGGMRPGMRLARDLIGPDGVLLLARGYVLDEALVLRLRQFERAERCTLRAHVDA